MKTETNKAKATRLARAFNDRATTRAKRDAAIDAADAKYYTAIAPHRAELDAAIRAAAAMKPTATTT